MMRPSSRPWGFAGWRWELLGQARGRTLEIGCGWGHNFAHYRLEQAAPIAAFDLDQERVRSAAELRAPVNLAIADAQHLAWPDGTFDSVVGTLVFCSIPEPARALAEACRVLRRDGRLYLVEHVRSHRAWLGQVQDLLAPAWLWATGGCHLNRKTLDAVRAAGYEVEQMKPGWGGLLNLIVAKPYPPPV